MTSEVQEAIHLTEAGRARLEQELQSLRGAHEPACRARLRDARESGRSDDAERHMAVEELQRVQARIGELEQLLAASAAGPPLTHGAVGAGSRVTARDEARRLHVFTLVSPLEAGSAPGLVSTESPVGAALLGRAPGDTILVQTPAGQRTFTVMSIE
jgi:transcription elongation factor GreA